jgi:beta-barrel assembly-enhancing protease
MNQVTEYPCHGFHDDLPDGKASGMLQVSAQGIDFVIGGMQGHFPLNGTHLQMGGASDRLVLLNHPDHKQWYLYTPERAILNNPHLQAHADLGKLVKKAKRGRHLAWGGALAALLIFVGLPVLLIFQSHLLTSPLARQVPLVVETSMAKAALAQYQMQHKTMPQAESDALLAPLLATLQPTLKKSRYRWQFMIANDPSSNAFALPGGYVVIHSGLILNARNANELLGVVGHEIAHVERQHGLQNMIASAGAYLLVSALFGDVTGLAAVLVNSAPVLLSQSYSRHFEEEADRVGMATLQQANINPQGLISFFETMKKEEEKQLGKIDDAKTREVAKLSMRFLSTHPATEKRIANLKQLLAQEKTRTWHDFGNAFPTLQAAVKTFTTTNPKKDTHEG